MKEKRKKGRTNKERVRKETNKQRTFLSWILVLQKSW
jgi:hypothetical protein